VTNCGSVMVSSVSRNMRFLKSTCAAAPPRQRLSRPVPAREVR